MGTIARGLVVPLVACVRALPEAPRSAEVTVTSPHDGETVPHPLVVVEGRATADRVTLRVGGAERTAPVVDGRFRALVLLEPGEQRVVVGARRSAAVDLRYEAPDTPRRVRMVYLLASDGDGSFDAPPGEPHDLASAVARLRVAGLLLETATGELMARAGEGRRTFVVDRDERGEVRVDVFRSALSLAEARALDGEALWYHFAEELVAEPGVKYAAVLSMTHHDAASGVTVAHTAHGGGDLGLFGSGTLHTWAASVEDVPAAWSDPDRPDAHGLLDDSAGRGTDWANYATGLGAMLHELGHTLGLPHSGDPLDVMERRFDHLDRVFVLVEDGRPVVDEEIRWSPVNAARLAEHPWISR